MSMSPSRWIIAGVISAALVALLAWQLVRERAMDACIAQGGVWDGRNSRCRPPPPRPIIQRDLHRT